MDDDKNWGWWAFGFLVAIALIIEAIMWVVTWVAAHYILCLCILAVICVIAYFLLFPKWYIKTPQGPEVDPLLYKAARFAVRENLSGGRSKIVDTLGAFLSINDKDNHRARGLFYELLFAGVLETKDWTHFRVPDLNKWDLKEVFARINSNPHFCSDAVGKWMGEVQSSFEVQEAKADNDEDCQIISVICSRRVLDIAIGFLSYYLTYFPPESADEKKGLEDTLANAKKKYSKKTNLVEKEEAIAALQKCIFDLDNTIDHVSFDSVTLKWIRVNGSSFDIPRFKHQNGDLYLFPSFAFQFKDNQSFKCLEAKVIHYGDIDVSSENYMTKDMPEEECNFDMEGMEYEWHWLYPRVNGDRDWRYSYNPRMFSFTIFRVKVPEFQFCYDFKLRSQAEEFMHDFETLKALATDSISYNVTK